MKRGALMHMFNRKSLGFGMFAGTMSTMCLSAAGADADRFEGRHYRGRGDVEYLQLLDTAPSHVRARP